MVIHPNTKVIITYQELLSYVIGDSIRNHTRRDRIVVQCLSGR